MKARIALFFRLTFASYSTPSLRLLAFAGLISLVSACSKLADVQPNELGYDYFPLEKGSFWMYDMKDVSYSLSAPPVVLQYQMKEVVADTFTDVSNQKSYRIERFVRDVAGDPWALDSVWTARRTATQAVRTENNIPFVKIVFPLRDRQKWNGNAFNSQGEEEYLMKSIGKPFSVGGQVFDETLTVYQSAEKDSSLVDQDKRFEVYAKEIGLIYHEKLVVQYCSSSQSCLGQGQIDYGVQRIQKIISYGKQ